MKLTTYSKEKFGWITAFILEQILCIVFGFVFSVNNFFLCLVIFLSLFFFLSYFLYEFYQKKTFYDKVAKSLASLDKKYLITEIIKHPDFLEGEIFFDTLYEIDKSMNEHIAATSRSVRDFREYVELWIHQVKLPLSALALMTYNGEYEPQKIKNQTNKITHYVEQILYYVRADSAEKDFMMKKCSLEQMVHAALHDYKDELIDSHFSIQSKQLDYFVLTDSKWIQFMLGQLINNSIKYQSGNHSTLSFYGIDTPTSTILSVRDNGIGIFQKDLRRVFDKSFTGENGRKVNSSTGMGLYLCRKLCERLGHEIRIESEPEQGTTIYIEFGKQNFYLTNS